MKINYQQAFRAIILLAFFGLLYKLHVTDDLSKFINMKYAMLSKIAAVIFLILFLIQLRRVWEPSDNVSSYEVGHQHEHLHRHSHVHAHTCDDHCGHDHGYKNGFSWKAVVAYGIVLVPLITGTLLPAKTLDAAIAAKKGVLVTKVSAAERSNEVAANPNGSESSSETPNADGNNLQDDAGTDQTSTDSEAGNDEIVYFEDIYTDTLEEMMALDVITLTEENFVKYADTIGFYPEKFVGKEIEVTGFVYKEDGMDGNQFVISRFIITHCVADAGVIGFLTESSDAPQFAVDEWVQLKGTLDVTDYSGSQLPIVKLSNWEKVSAPADPYVYPQ